MRLHADDHQTFPQGSIGHTTAGNSLMTSTITALEEQVLRLATFQPTDMPVLSVYLNTQPDQHGRDNFDSFLRKEFKLAAEAFAPRSAQRESVDTDVSRISEWLRTSLQPSSNGVALFACSAAENLFEAVQFDAPVEKNQFYVYNQPHIFGLARLRDQYPRHAVVVADTNFGRILTFGLGETLGTETVSNTKIRDMTEVGRWSRSKENSREENYRMQHASELTEQLDGIVRSEQIDFIILAGDSVILPTLRDQLSPYLADRVVATLPLDVRTPEHEIRAASHTALREYDVQLDTGRVHAMLDLHHSGGRAAVGVEHVLAALKNGQVEELFVSARFDERDVNSENAAALASSLAAAGDALEGNVADSLISRAVQTAARITFVEDDDLLAPFGGTAATLRYTL